MKVDCVHAGQKVVVEIADSQVREYAITHLGIVRGSQAARLEQARETQSRTATALEERRKRFDEKLAAHAKLHGLNDGAAQFSFLQTEEGQGEWEWERVRQAELEDSRERRRLAKAELARA